MSQHSIRKRRKNIEDDSHANEDLPARDIELIDFLIEPPDHRIVDLKGGVHVSERINDNNLTKS